MTAIITQEHKETVVMLVNKIFLNVENFFSFYDNFFSIDIYHKIAISSIVIGLKNSYFPLINLPSCYRTVCYRTVCYRTVQQTNQIQVVV